MPTGHASDFERKQTLLWKSTLWLVDLSSNIAILFLLLQGRGQIVDIHLMKPLVWILKIVCYIFHVLKLAWWKENRHKTSFSTEWKRVFTPEMWTIVITKQLRRVHHNKKISSAVFGVFNANEQTQENQFLLLYIYGLYLCMYVQSLEPLQ